MSWISLPALRRLLRAACLVLPALLAAGCISSGPSGGSTGFYDVVGTVVFGPRALRMDAARVTLTGPVQRTTYTDARGTFRFADVPEGSYQVRAETLAGTAQASVYLRDDQTLQLQVPYPAGFDEAYFFDLSGLWNLYAGSDGQLYRSAGSGNWRWRSGSTVALYIGDPPPGYSSWRDRFWQLYASRWPAVVGGQVSVTRVGSEPAQGIVVEWVPHGSLGDEVGAAQVIEWDQRGEYIIKALVQIDEAYGDPDGYPVAGHEFWHVTGAGHSPDPTSLMYPLLSDSNRWARDLTATERSYLRYAFAIGPGQSVTPYGQSGGVSGQSATAPSPGPDGRRLMTVLTRTDGRRQVVSGLAPQLERQPRVRALFNLEAGARR